MRGNDEKSPALMKLADKTYRAIYRAKSEQDLEISLKKIWKQLQMHRKLIQELKRLKIIS